MTGALGENELAGNLASNAMGAAAGEIPDPSAALGGAASGFMSKMSLGGSKDLSAMAGKVGSNLMSTLPIAGGLSFNYNPKMVKSQNILTSHLPTLTTGSMAIFLTNDQTSLFTDEPLTGKIYVNMNEAFDAGSLTMNLIGYERCSIESTNINKDNTICDVKYPVASFDPGYVQTGASEFPFSITLPKEVKEIFLL